MADKLDKLFSDYLKKTLSRYFQISVLDNPELLMDTAISQNPDAIIIDDNVNGISGDILSTQIKEDKTIGYIPIILLLRAFDNESYLSHLGSGADRLGLRTESICKLRADILIGWLEIYLYRVNTGLLRFMVKKKLLHSLSPCKVVTCCPLTEGL